MQPPEAKQATSDDAPSLRTLANCIEKTASFICVQGAQMEILMRAKEAGNPKFQFLNPDNPYHQIYRQVLEKKRSRPKNYVDPATAAALDRAAAVEVERSLQTLIHSMKNAAPEVSGFSSSASASSVSSTNAYSTLVQRIRENQIPLQQTPSPKQSTPPPPDTSQPPPPPQETKVEEKVEDDSAHLVTVTPPPITMHPIIDKTASYVARKGAGTGSAANGGGGGGGKDVLQALKKHDPEKFVFLNPDNQYNAFFRYGCLPNQYMTGHSLSLFSRRYKVALYEEMLAESGITPNGNGSDNQLFGSAPSSKFPTLKGFFR